ncbi:MAG: tRNA (adenosine(37)-N6)-dimethylallyltransferase MiaA [Bacillota bacterium]
MNNRLVVIVGATGVGKTKLGVEIASQINAEIVSGDSMQVYKGMDIGTAKISADEMFGANGVKVLHHMIDIVSPLENYSVAEFQEDARRCIQDINSREKIPILLGGTGLYVRAVIDKYSFEKNTNLNVRRRIREIGETLGNEYLYNRLKEVDPLSAVKYHYNDVRRIARALEFYEITGRPISSQTDAYTRESIYCPLLIIGLWLPRNVLYQQINQRVDNMIKKGLVDEVKLLIEQGVKLDSTSMQAIGYRQIVQYLQNKCSLERAVELIKRDTRRFAKRQITWFKIDPRIKWFDVSQYEYFKLIDEIKGEISRNINI